MKPKRMYFTLCIGGTVVPYAVFLPWLAGHGLNLRLLVQEIFANRISIFFVLDVVVSAVVVLAFGQWSNVASTALSRLVIPALLLVGVSLAFPLLLYLRESALDELQGDTVDVGSTLT
jgi:hypothetical protein